MLNIERILGPDRLVRAMTGLKRQAFEDLLPNFAIEYERANSTRNKSRQRARGGGAKAKLEKPREKLFYIERGNYTRKSFMMKKILLAVSPMRS
jgi:hypothetical protein